MKKYINIHSESFISVSCEKFTTPLILTLGKNISFTKLVPLLSTKNESFRGSFCASPKKTTLLYRLPVVSENKATDETGTVIVSGALQRCVWAADALAPGHCLLRWRVASAPSSSPVPPAPPPPHVSWADLVAFS